MAYFDSKSELAWPVEAAEVLAFALLHEAGHIHYGTTGALWPTEDQELRADLFAVDLIERAQASSVDQVHDAGVKLNLLLTKLEWDLGLRRDPVSAGFGGNQAAFFDSSYTHPNLEFRLRVVGAVAEAKDAAIH